MVEHRDKSEVSSVLKNNTFWIIGQVAQLVEQRPEKPCVASSILALSTKYDAEMRHMLFVFQGNKRR